MEDVEMRLVAKTAAAVKEIRNVADEAERTATIVEKVNKKQVDTIESLTKEMKALFETQKKGFSTTKQIEDYTNKVNQVRAALDALQQTEKKTTETTNDLTDATEDLTDATGDAKTSGDLLSQTIGKAAISFGGAVAILNALKAAFIATTAGMNLFNIAGAAVKQVMYNIVTGASNLTDGLGKVIAAQKELNRLRLQEKVDLYNSRIEELKFTEALVNAHDKTKSVTEQIKFYDEAILHKNKSVALEIASTEAQIVAYEKILDASPGDEKSLLAWMALKTRVVDLKESAKSALKEITSMQSGLIKSASDDLLKWREDLHNNLQKLADEQNDIDAANEAKAIKKSKDREVAAALETVRIESDVRDYIVNLDKDYYDKLDKLREEERKQKEKDWNFEMDYAKKLFKFNDDQAKAQWDAILEAEKLAKETEDDLKNKRIEAVKKGLESLLKFTQEITDREVEDTQRQRELLDTRIGQVQQELDQEIQLYKANYASNVDAKKKELADLKKQRDQALKNEEEAIKKQRLMESIAQGVNIFTSATNILKSFTKLGPLGIALAAGAITAMFAIVADAKSKAAKASFAKGGWTGPETGGYRDSTGEEVAGTVHKKEFVVKRGPAHKFRDVLEAINRDDRRAIFNSFNKISPELLGGTTVNNVVIQNDGPNKRLDEVNSQLRRLNMREEVIHNGSTTIIRRGNNIRTIKQ